ncbi:MAG: hypothetical protein LBM70_06945 [Victivallales bacterium]|jgi:xylulokinase|nr:hypothetical protein [Victivallales bacterium]
MALYLGIDLSTQGVKAELIDPDNPEIKFGGFSVNFGADLPEYGAPDGFVSNPDPLIRVADPAMWLDAIELLFARMHDSGAPLGEIAGISGSAQQHATVYLKKSFPQVLEKLDKAKTLSEQIVPCLSRRFSPIWMDRSTTCECKELESRFGDRLRLETGSPAVERFGAAQIRKFAKESSDIWRDTATVHLASSFFTSVLCGVPSPIDYGDGAGMNLLNLKTLTWDAEIAEFSAPGLLDKLPKAAPSATVAGNLSPYFTKYGFRAGTPVAVWSGDNPNSLIGVGAGEPGIAVVSLGTSDTFFAAMRDFRTDPDGYGHVFGDPAGGFMSLICFTNGSLAREEIRKKCGISYAEFDQITPIPENENLMLPYFVPESTPLVLRPQVQCNFDWEKASANERVRALLESQILSMRLHSTWQNEKIRRIRVTGGASKSAALLRIIADVFQSEVETIAVANSAGLGAAIRAANAIDSMPFEALYRNFCAPIATTYPNSKQKSRYMRMLEAYRKLETAT